MALLEASMRITLGLPPATVPDQHGAAAIFAFRDGAFELVVFDRMVFDLHREPLLARHQTRAPRRRPALHHAVEFEPQIVVQPGGSVFLDDELVALAPSLPATRLRRDVELAFLVVDLQSHGSARLLQFLALHGMFGGAFFGPSALVRRLVAR